MKHHISARGLKSAQPLNGTLIRAVCASIFPKRNDYNHAIEDFDELVPELARWGLTTRTQLQQLLTHHRRVLLEIDRSLFDGCERKIYDAWYGEVPMLAHRKGRYFFAYPGFVRNALELQFGEAAAVSDPKVSTESANAPMTSTP
jgi:hypothetical protein